MSKLFYFRYDNEYGYSHRVIDLLKYIAAQWENLVCLLTYISLVDVWLQSVFYDSNIFTYFIKYGINNACVCLSTIILKQ